MSRVAEIAKAIPFRAEVPTGRFIDAVCTLENVSFETAREVIYKMLETGRAELTNRYTLRPLDVRSIRFRGGIVSDLGPQECESRLTMILRSCRCRKFVGHDGDHVCEHGFAWADSGEAS